MYRDESLEAARTEPLRQNPTLPALFDVDELIDRMAEEAVSPRRRAAGRPGRPMLPASAPADGRTRDNAPRIELVLYTSPSSEKSQRAVRAIREILKRYDASQVKFTTCDLSVNPQDGDVDAVVFTPTLVKQGPGPRTSIIGNLEQEEILCDLLEASGVERRWDG